MQKDIGKIIDFLNENRSGYLATVEGNMPRVRPWGFMLEKDGKYWFLTSNNKRVFNQLKENPYIEFCSSSQEFTHLRLSGKIEFCNDMDIKKQMFEVCPMLKDVYVSHEDSVLESFYVEHGTASLTTCYGADEFFEF